MKELTKDMLSDKIFELEMEQKEIQMCLTQAAIWGNETMKSFYLLKNTIVN